jgi:hypothetical protein
MADIHALLIMAVSGHGTRPFFTLWLMPKVKSPVIFCFLLLITLI